MAISVFDATIANDVTDHHPVPIDKWSVKPPMVLGVARIVIIHVTGGDQAKSGGGVFTIRMDVFPRTSES